MAVDYEVLVAISVNDVEIELVGTVGGSDAAAVFDIDLTEAARNALKNTSIGDIKSAAQGLYEALGIGSASDDFITELTTEVKKVPVLGDLIDAVLGSPIYLTDLDYKTDDLLTVGIMIEFGKDIGPLTFERAGVKATVDLKKSE